jgi:hypothetical protein
MIVWDYACDQEYDSNGVGVLPSPLLTQAVSDSEECSNLCLNNSLCKGARYVIASTQCFLYTKEL